MKRDFDLIRKIMLAMEEHKGPRPLDANNITGYRVDEVIYNMDIMRDHGLIVLLPSSGVLNQHAFAVRLTWEGHEFLDTARDDKMWKKALATVLEKAGTITFDLLKALLIEWGNYEPEAFDVFGPKLITTRERFQDEAIESRCLTIEVQGKSPDELMERGVPIHLNKRFFEEAAQLQNIMLSWRLRTWQPDVELDEDLADPTVSTRINQIMMPLKQIVKDEGVREQFALFARRFNERTITGMSMRLEAKVLEAIVEIHESEPSKDGMTLYFDLSMKNIARVANEIIDRENIDEEDEEDIDVSSRKKLKARRVGSIVRNKLSLVVEQQTSGPQKKRYFVVWDEDRIARLRTRYGV